MWLFLIWFSGVQLHNAEVSFAFVSLSSVWVEIFLVSKTLGFEPLTSRLWLAWDGLEEMTLVLHVGADDGDDKELHFISMAIPPACFISSE